MNYKKIYFQLIERAQKRQIDNNSYYESHHIIPKCINGNNNEENLVELTAREHFIAHWLLVKINPENFKLLCAWNSFCRFNPLNNGDRIVSHNYEYCRIRWIKKLIERKITHPDWWKNWTKGSTGSKWMNKNNKNYRAKIDEIEQKLEDGWILGRNSFKRKPHSEEHKQKISNRFQERKNEGWKSPLKGKQQKKDIQCPHCKKIGGMGQMSRWHFDKCKVLVNQKT